MSKWVKIQDFFAPRLCNVKKNPVITGGIFCVIVSMIMLSR